MEFNQGEYEVEFRCRFDSPEDAYRALPFLQLSLTRRVPWTSTMYGLDFFQSGKLLRIGEGTYNGKIQYFLSFKGPDIGNFCNIRQEIDENITEGITGSIILRTLGGKTNLKTRDEAALELERLGYKPFMSWSGVDILGVYQPFGINVKLMSATVLEWPCIVEIEKIAAAEEEARQCEIELQKICRQFHLESRLLKTEPPQLLYDKVFGHKPV
jgi:adenylate cyclase class IV